MFFYKVPTLTCQVNYQFHSLLKLFYGYIEISYVFPIFLQSGNPKFKNFGNPDRWSQLKISFPFKVILWLYGHFLCFPMFLQSGKPDWLGQLKISFPIKVILWSCGCFLRFPLFLQNGNPEF